jgi:hypothetical protein
MYLGDNGIEVEEANSAQSRVLLKMPSLLVTVFLLQLAIHFVNTFGASTINTLVWHAVLTQLL